MTNEMRDPNFSDLIEPFVEQAVLSQRRIRANEYGTLEKRNFITPETELASTSLYAPIRVPVSLGPDFWPVSLRTLADANGSALQVAYLDTEDELTSLLVREMSEEGEMPADFNTREEYQILFWIDGPLIYTLVGNSDEVALRSMAQSIYTSNAIGGEWLREQGEPVQPASHQ